MNADHVRRLESLLGRELRGEEKERLGRVQSILAIDENDATWDLLVAMEYQRAYYTDLPAKISAATTSILQGLAEAAQAEAKKAQSSLVASVVDHARKLSLRINIEKLLPLGIVVLACQLLYGSLTMWAGYCIGNGEWHGPEWLLRMPSGFVIAGLCLAGGLFLGVYTANEFAEGRKGWWKKTLLALAFVIAGMIVFTLSL
jgi:hypothetical protein